MNGGERNSPVGIAACWVGAIDCRTVWIVQDQFQHAHVDCRSESDTEVLDLQGLGSFGVGSGRGRDGSGGSQEDGGDGGELHFGKAFDDGFCLNLMGFCLVLDWV